MYLDAPVLPKLRGSPVLFSIEDERIGDMLSLAPRDQTHRGEDSTHYHKWIAKSFLHCNRNCSRAATTGWVPDWPLSVAYL